MKNSWLYLKFLAKLTPFDSS